MDTELVMNMEELIAFMEANEHDFIIHIHLEEEGISDA